MVQSFPSVLPAAARGQQCAVPDDHPGSSSERAREHQSRSRPRPDHARRHVTQNAFIRRGELKAHDSSDMDPRLPSLVALNGRITPSLSSFVLSSRLREVMRATHGPSAASRLGVWSPPTALFRDTSAASTPAPHRLRSRVGLSITSDATRAARCARESAERTSASSGSRLAGG